MLKTRKIPMRMCVGCREMKPKKELVRIVRNNEGVISVDRTGKAPGRGAYLCPSAPCLERAIKMRSLNKAFACQVDASLLTGLKESLLDGG